MKNIRYVIVNRGKPPHESELRFLSLPAQGRNTYSTREAAEKALVLFLGPNGLERVLGGRVNTCEVLAVECWPGHNDPKKTVFGDDYAEPTP